MSGEKTKTGGRMEFDKAKVESKAKILEERVGQSIESTNRSVIRALARGKAAREIYTGKGSEEEILDTLVKKFYTGAKFHPTWDETISKHDPHLAVRMKAFMGTPAPRKRKNNT